MWLLVSGYGVFLRCMIIVCEPWWEI